MPKQLNQSEASALASAFRSVVETDGEGGPVHANVVDGLFALARSIQGLSASIDMLGLNGASTSRGALEVLSQEIKEGSERISAALTSAHENDS